MGKIWRVSKLATVVCLFACFILADPIIGLRRRRGSIIILFLKLCRRARFSIFPRHSPSTPVQVEIQNWARTTEDPSLDKTLAWIKAHKDDDVAAFADEEEIPAVKKIGSPIAPDYQDFLAHNKL